MPSIFCSILWIAFRQFEPGTIFLIQLLSFQRKFDILPPRYTRFMRKGLNSHILLTDQR